MLLEFLTLLIGIALLAKGADYGVDAAVRIAKALGISRLFIGLTVMAIGTSLPELAVSSLASWQAEASISVGNIVGSNIFNISIFIIAAGLIAKKYRVFEKKVLDRDAVWLLVSALMLFALGFYGYIPSIIGFFMVLLYFIYLKTLYKEEKIFRSNNVVKREKLNVKDVALVVIALFSLYFGARLVIYAVVSIFYLLGISKWAMSAGIVAFGTSLPEFTTILTAFKKNYGDVSVGTIIGSNVSNILLVLGTASMLKALPLSFAKNVLDFYIMLAFSILMTISIIRNRFEKWEAISFIFLLALYLLFLSSKAVL